MYTKVRLITFDAMDTLFTTKSLPGCIYLCAAKTMFPSCISATVKNLSEQNIHKQFKKVFSSHYHNYTATGQHRTTAKQFWHTVISNTLINTGVSLKTKEMTMVTDALYEDFGTAKYWKLFPGVVNVLERLHLKGVKTGIVSNFDERLEGVLKELDIFKYFDFIVFPPATGDVGKPEAKPFEMALALGGYEAFETVHIGDSLEMDYLASMDLGMKPLLLSHSQNKDSNEYIRISALYELFDVVDFEIDKASI